MDMPKPCPKCGKVPEAYSDFSCVYELIYGTVECETCGITIRGEKTFNTYSASFEGYDTPEWVKMAHAEAKKSAIEEWNKNAISKETE